MSDVSSPDMAPRPLRAESEVAEKAGVQRVVTALPAPGLSMRLTTGHKKNERSLAETTAQDTLKQNWSKYSAADKSECIGMVTTGGPASYVELLSCVEILRDARNIRNTDAFASDDSAVSSRRRRRK